MNKQSKNLLAQLDELEGLAAKATEGPWEINRQYEQVWSPGTRDFVNTCDSPHDSAFIAAARNFLTPANIAALRAAALSPSPVATEGAGQPELQEDEDAREHWFGHETIRDIANMESFADPDGDLVVRLSDIHTLIEGAGYAHLLPQPQKGGQPNA